MNTRRGDVVVVLFPNADLRAIGKTGPEINSRHRTRFCLATATPCELPARRRASMGNRLDGPVLLEPGFLVRNPG